MIKTVTFTQAIRQQTVDRIRKLVRDPQDIFIDIKQTPQGEYRTTIKLKRRAGLYVAHKRGTTISDSVHKTCRALLRQVMGEKHPRLHSQHSLAVQI